MPAGCNIAMGSDFEVCWISMITSIMGDLILRHAHVVFVFEQSTWCVRV